MFHFQSSLQPEFISENQSWLSPDKQMLTRSSDVQFPVPRKTRLMQTLPGTGVHEEVYDLQLHLCNWFLTHRLRRLYWLKFTLRFWNIFNKLTFTSSGFKWNVSAILPYSSLTFEKPSIRPVGLPCASCVWNTSFGRMLAGGAGSPPPFTADFPTPACPLTSSFSTKFELSFDLFFFFLSPKGMFAPPVNPRGGWSTR